MQFQNYKSKILYTLLVVSFFSFTFLSNTQPVIAQDIDELNDQIDSYEDKIREIEREIEQQRLLIQTTSAKAGEIQGRINTLNATKNKLKSDITRTQNVIAKSELSIEKIDIEMTDKERSIELTQRALAEAMQDLDQHSDNSLINIALDSGTLSDFLEQVFEIRKFKETLIDKKYELLDLNRELSQKKVEELKTKEELEKEKQILAGQQQSIISTQNEQVSLLTQTQNEQQKYEQLLKEKEAQKEQFNALVRDIESQIQKLIDPESFPDAQKGILAWPSDTVVITQLFGGTEFAAQNPHIYGRPYHPGVDFGMPTGTKIKSVASGTVRASGNTDAFPGCVAWGKWLLIDHDNGLSSLYAHLSSVLVSNGQSVASGEVVALSGNTGYSTGPHLHLTIYATQGVEVGKYGTYKPGGSGCAATNATGPFADLDAYLDPMEYLPSL